MEKIDTQSAASSDMVDAMTQTAIGNGDQHLARQGPEIGPERSFSPSGPVTIPGSIGKLSSELTPTPPQPGGPGQLRQSRTFPATNSMSAISTVPQKWQVPAKIEDALAEVRKAWQLYRRTNRRHAVYYYLEAVFALVTRWQRDKCALKNSKAALKHQRHAPKMKAEPFAIVIFCTCDAVVADAKTRSKWSRVLRLARKAKPVEQRLTDFVKSRGGLNECARRFVRRRPLATG